MKEYDSVVGNSLSPIRVQLMPVDDLRPFERNARIHSEAAIGRLIAIIGDIGWTNPILVDGVDVVAGHKRRLAALEIYGAGGTIKVPSGQFLPAGLVPVIDVSGWTEAQRRAYVIADNQTTLESEWDLGVLRLELEWLTDAGADLALTGFDAAALEAALCHDEGGEPAEVGEEVFRVSLADRFGVPPFSVLSAREGWWQDRKRAWLRLGIQSELGRGEGDMNAAPSGSPRPLDRAKAAKASPGGSPRPATNYGTSKARGNGRGQAVPNV